MFDFSSAADDFFVNLNLQTNLALPTNRETLLPFLIGIGIESLSVAPQHIMRVRAAIKQISFAEAACEQSGNAIGTGVLSVPSC